ncbi:MAG: iron-containing alcohol dehydrogenase [Defluviitaleaceae bacterium]|nr:iron-containing alcohol dehydrogenase [Defluviitaleaceae bacterium]
MKVLILNSGTGSRMKGLATCKCLVELEAGVTIIDAQLKALLRCGLSEIYITTGSHASELENYVRERYPHMSVTFINNPVYDKTNYIYSIHLAKDFLLDDDIVLLHGDLVFEENVLQDILASDDSVMVTDSTKSLPEKDFKAVVENGRIVGVGIEMFNNAVYAQPMYKLTKEDWALWLAEIGRFCDEGITGVYAENAFNNISNTMNVLPFDITGRMCFEVDNNDDLFFAQNAYKKMPDRIQNVYSGSGSCSHIENILSQAKSKKPFIVCGIDKDSANKLIGDNIVCFEEFTPNPDVSEVDAGISLFEKEKCDFIISIGGGSAIDIAKCINMMDCGTPRTTHLAIPTTAGTGSESTCFAVLYKNGEKISVENPHLIPKYVILDSAFLGTLPMYHKKSTALDALCQSIESLWARGKTTESESYASSAMHLIYENIEGYISGNASCAMRMLQASNLSGKAINISKTTAAHAMSYKMTAMFGLAHGHAVALCLPVVWAKLLESNVLPEVLNENQLHKFISVFRKMKLEFDFAVITNDIAKELADSVNIQRLNNHPVKITKSELVEMYKTLGREW